MFKNVSKLALQEDHIETISFLISIQASVLSEGGITHSFTLVLC